MLDSSSYKTTSIEKKKEIENIYLGTIGEAIYNSNNWVSIVSILWDERKGGILYNTILKSESIWVEL